MSESDCHEIYPFCGVLFIHPCPKTNNMYAEKAACPKDEQTTFLKPNKGGCLYLCLNAARGQSAALRCVKAVQQAIWRLLQLFGTPLSRHSIKFLLQSILQWSLPTGRLVAVHANRGSISSFIFSAFMPTYSRSFFVHACSIFLHPFLCRIVL